MKEVLDEKAVPLLKDLENLNILRIRPSLTPENDTILMHTPKLSEQFWGTLSPETVSTMHTHVETIRNEWERDI